MDSDIVIMIGLGPFYAMAVYFCWFGANYGMHKLQELSQSAQQTQMTATTSPPAQVSTGSGATAGTK